MKIERLWLKNYFSFKDSVFNFGNINFLIGPNGAGSIEGNNSLSTHFESLN